MPKILAPADLSAMLTALVRRIECLERTEQLGKSSTRAGTTRWKDAGGADQVVVGLLDDATYGVSTTKWVATTTTSGTDMTLSGGLTADHAAIGAAGGGASGLTLGPSGTRLTRVRVFSASLTPTSVAAASVSRQTFAVTGLTTADKVVVNPPSASGNVALCAARASAADTLELTFVNPSAGALTPTSGTYVVVAVQS